jgi:hypothetical protein
MGRRCSICDHPNRPEIELAVSRRVGVRQIAQKWGVSMWAISRHALNHLPPQVRSALAATGLPSPLDLDALRKSESEGLLQTLVNQRARLFRLLDAAEEVCDLKAATSVHGRITDNVALVAKLLGEITTHSQTTVNQLVVSPEYLTLRSKLLVALAPFPEARRAVARALQDLEGAPPHVTGVPKVLEHASES